MELRGCPICGEQYTHIKEISGRYWGWHWCQGLGQIVEAIAWDNQVHMNITNLVLPRSPFDGVV